MKRILFLTTLFLGGIQLLSFSQDIPYVLSKDNQEIKKISKKISENGWVYLNESLKLQSSDLAKKYKKAFGYLDQDNVVQYKTNKDSLSEIHYYKQFHNNIEVENSEFVVHLKKGIAVLCYGDVMRSNTSITPFLTEEQAFGIAKNHFFPNGNFPTKFKIDSLYKDYRPKGKLVYTKFQSDEKIKNEHYILCYTFNMITSEPFDVKRIYIDALNGKIVLTKSLIEKSSGTVATWYNYSHSFTTFFVQGFPRGKFRLQDRTRGYIHPKVNATGEISTYWDPYIQSWVIQADWDNRNYAEQNSDSWGPSLESTALWAIESAYDYFHNKFGRHGTDGNNMQVRIYPAAYTKTDQGGSAYLRSDIWESDGIDLQYDGIYILNSFPLGDFYVTLDVLGHEFTHGVNHYSNDVGGGTNIEAQALMESFGDIFGEMIQSYTLGTIPDWMGGYEANTNSYKNFASPHSPGDPLFQYAAYVNDLPFWNGDRYKKSGVQNRWFYLLSNSIGSEKAARIAYRNMTYYLTSNSDYFAAREGSINASSDYYGACSYETDQVKNAWNTVGVGAAAIPCLQASISGPESLMCQEYGYYYANVYGGSGNYSYSWFVDYTLYSQESYVSLAFNPQYGDEYHSISLTVTDENGSDSDEKSVYVFYCGQGNVNTSGSLGFTMYPNPTKLSTTLIVEEESLTSKPYKVQIIDRSGKIVFIRDFYEKELKINTSNLQKGIYHIVVKSDKKYGSTKLIIE